METKLQFGYERKTIPSFIYENLKKFTKLDDEVLRKLIARSGVYPNHIKEWELWHPETDEEINWFYKSSKTYIFANSSHSMPEKLFNKIKDNSTIFDFGGGAGTISFTLAILKNCKSFYFDVNLLQSEFVKFSSIINDLDITVLSEEDNSFNPKINTKIDYIIALDVFEHIPDYPRYVKILSELLNPGGKFFVYAPFGKSEPSHLEDKYVFRNVCENNNLQHNGIENYITEYTKR